MDDVEVDTVHFTWAQGDVKFLKLYLRNISFLLENFETVELSDNYCHQTITSSIRLRTGQRCFMNSVAPDKAERGRIDSSSLKS